jgi:phosphonopyruvate decarboxylase
MISAQTFCEELANRQFSFASGVPCSYFSGPIALLDSAREKYLPAANEGSALAAAAGAVLAGRRAYVMLQNSGLGNVINPLTSLASPYRIPVLLFVSLRGWPDPAGDEPQHELMGRSTHALLDAIGMPHETLRKDDGPDRFHDLLDTAESELAKGGPAFVLVQKGSIGNATSTGGVPARPGRNALGSPQVVRLVADLTEGCLVIASTGFPSRELFAVADRPGHFYMQGSMGHASAVGLGVARNAPDRTVVVLDGDGAALMHLGALAMIADSAPANLVHVILDNGIHESTGGQRTAGETTSFAGVAAAAGYRSAVECETFAEVADALRSALSSPGPHLCVVRTLPRSGSMPPRATSTASPGEFAARFTGAIRSPCPFNPARCGEE